MKNWPLISVTTQKEHTPSDFLIYTFTSLKTNTVAKGCVAIRENVSTLRIQKSHFSLQAVKLHENYDVYVLKADLDQAVKFPKASIFLRQMVGKVYTDEALKSATPRGFPGRGKGRSACRKKKTLPRLHPDGLDALLGKMTSMVIFPCLLQSAPLDLFGHAQFRPP